MSQFNIQGLDELIGQLERLGKLDDIAPKMLEEAIPILEKEVVMQAEKYTVMGDIAASIKKTEASVGKNGGYYICTRPTGKDKNGIGNMEKMSWLEYGVKGRAGTPVLTTAVLNAEPDVIRKMKEVFDREVAEQ